MLKYAKISNEQTKQCDVALGNYVPEGFTQMNVEQAYNGSWYVEGYAPEEPAPTEEEQRQKREIAYTQEVDPITCHISRLADEEQTPEIEQEIAELKQERSAKVEEIKERYPYPVDTDPEYDVLVEGQ